MHEATAASTNSVPRLTLEQRLRLLRTYGGDNFAAYAAKAVLEHPEEAAALAAVADLIGEDPR